jgi:hypothetical protein
MNQALYAHMNNKRKREKNKRKGKFIQGEMESNIGIFIF